MTDYFFRWFPEVQDFLQQQLSAPGFSAYQLIELGSEACGYLVRVWTY